MQLHRFNRPNQSVVHYIQPIKLIGLKRFLFFLFFLPFGSAFSQDLKSPALPPGLDIHVSLVDGVLLFTPSAVCAAEACNTNVSLLKLALTHMVLRKPGKGELNAMYPLKVGNTKIYFTTYHYPFHSSRQDTVLSIENDSILIHDVGADGLLTDSAQEYCINKFTHQRLDWKSNYDLLVQSGVCPIACLMRSMHEAGYQGYILQLNRDGKADVMFY